MSNLVLLVDNLIIIYIVVDLVCDNDLVVIVNVVEVIVSD